MPRYRVTVVLDVEAGDAGAAERAAVREATDGAAHEVTVISVVAQRQAEDAEGRRAARERARENLRRRIAARGPSPLVPPDPPPRYDDVFERGVAAMDAGDGPPSADADPPNTLRGWSEIIRENRERALAGRASTADEERPRPCPEAHRTDDANVALRASRHAARSVAPRVAAP